MRIINSVSWWSLVMVLLMSPSTSTALGSVLAEVPTQGSMIHVTIRFRNSGSKGLAVTVDSTVAKLIPLSVSDPGDSFDPDDPWFSPLQGAGFNRAFGFIMSPASDPLPSAHYGIWIRRVSSTPGLAAYRYRRSPGAVFEPILGTADSSDVWAWNLTMFHPCFAAPAETGQPVMTLEAFVVDTRTGEPVAGYAKATFTLVFNSISELKITRILVQSLEHEISWNIPLSNRNYQVLWSTNATKNYRALSGDLKPPQSTFTNRMSVAPPAAFYRVVIK